jgi:ABC-type glycerol-3-phosphate transport system substrate-binding protein
VTYLRLKSAAGVIATVSTLALASACTGAGPGQKAGGNSLTATYMKSGTYDTAAQSLASSFAKRTGTHVKVLAFPYDALRQNNTNAVISGQCDYNVISGSYYLADIYNKFQSLDSFATKSHYPSQLAAGLWAHSEYDQGHHIGVPYGPDAYSLMYRTDLFRKAGLSWPKSWPQLLSDLQTLKSKYGAQGVAPFAFAAGQPEQLPALFFATYDGSFINSSGHYALDTAAATRAIGYAQRLLALAGPNAKSQSIDAANATFVNGHAAVLYGWPSFLRTQADDPGQSKVAGHWAVGVDPQPGLVWLSLWQMYMTKCTTDPTSAWKWMTTFSSPKTDKKLFVKDGVNPSFKTTYHDTKLAKQHANYFPGLQANLARAVNPPLSGEAQDYLASTLGNVFTGQTSPAAAVSQINQKWSQMTVPAPLLAEGKKDGLVQQ